MAKNLSGSLCENIKEFLSNFSPNKVCPNFINSFCPSSVELSTIVADVAIHCKELSFLFNASFNFLNDAPPTQGYGVSFSINQTLIVHHIF